MKTLYCLMVVFFLLLSVSCPAQVDRTEEALNLLAGIESTGRMQRIKAAKIISREGLQSEVLYEKVAQALEEGYSQHDSAGNGSAQFGEMDHTDEMSWFCKALAASGDVRYLPLLEKIAKDAPSYKLRHYAKQSRDLLDDYKLRADILNDTEWWNNSLSDEENRIANALRADDLSLVREAAKKITRRFKTSDVIFSLAARKLQIMRHSESSSEYIDTMAWLCKALAASGDEKYLELLKNIYDETKSTKLKSYAKKAIRAME